MTKDIEAGKKVAVEKRKREECLADKRRRGAPKREEKAKLKQALKVGADKIDTLETFSIGQRALETFNNRKKLNSLFKGQNTCKANSKEKFGLKPPESKEIIALKDETVEAIRKGKQSRLPVKRFNVSERKRQLEESEIKERKKQEKEKNHFYVIDFETTGKKKPEPICVAAIRYEKGQRKEIYKTYFLPDKDIDAEAEKLHKFTKWRLKASNSKRFSRDSAELLI